MKRATIEQRTVLLATVGSHAYGLNTPTSDRDIKGVCIAPTDYYYSSLYVFDQKDKGWADPHDPPSGKFPVLGGVEDCTIYEMRKFIKLAADNNPSILEMLWLNNYEYLDPLVGEGMVAHKATFLSKRVRHTYGGYAHAQLRKVETHRKWLLDPPTAKPNAEDYGIDTNHLPLSKSQVGAFLEFLVVLVRDTIEFMEPVQELRKLLLEDIDLVAIIKQRPLGDDVLPYIQQMTRGSNDFMQLLQRSQGYANAIKHWDSYQQWKGGRNPERAALEAKCGFDGKHASHCVRLLRQGLEILQTGELVVDRRDAGDVQELLAIRHGDRTYDEVLAITDSLFIQLDEAYGGSKLPHSVDRELVHNLCCQWVQEYFKVHG